MANPERKRYSRTKFLEVKKNLDPDIRDDFEKKLQKNVITNPDFHFDILSESSKIKVYGNKKNIPNPKFKPFAHKSSDPWSDDGQYGHVPDSDNPIEKFKDKKKEEQKRNKFDQSNSVSSNGGVRSGVSQNVANAFFDEKDLSSRSSTFKFPPSHKTSSASLPLPEPMAAFTGDSAGASRLSSWVKKPPTPPEVLGQTIPQGANVINFDEIEKKIPSPKPSKPQPNHQAPPMVTNSDELLNLMKFREVLQHQVRFPMMNQQQPFFQPQPLAFVGGRPMNPHNIFAENQKIFQHTQQNFLGERPNMIPFGQHPSMPAQMTMLPPSFGQPRHPQHQMYNYRPPHLMPNQFVPPTHPHIARQPHFPNPPPQHPSTVQNRVTPEQLFKELLLTQGSNDVIIGKSLGGGSVPGVKSLADIEAGKK